MVIYTSNGGRYEGMDQATVRGLLDALGLTSVTFVTEAEYNAIVLARQPIPLTPAQILATARAQAIYSIDTDIGPLGKSLRGLLLVLLDEFNILRQRERDRAADVAAALTLADLKVRWAARSLLNDRDITQVKPAVQNKINGGDAD